MSTEMTYPTCSTLSQLLRLLSEQNVSDQQLNGLYQTGLLARLLRAKPQEVNLTAYERVLGLADPLDEARFDLTIDYNLNLGGLLTEGGFKTVDSLHYEVVMPSFSRVETRKAVITHVNNPTYGKIQRLEKERGLRSADLRELLFFSWQYDCVGHRLYALGTRQGGHHPTPPQIFCTEQNIRFEKTLGHISSYGPFQNSSRFLGIVIE